MRVDRAHLPPQAAKTSAADAAESEGSRTGGELLLGDRFVSKRRQASGRSVDVGARNRPLQSRARQRIVR